MGVVKNNTEKVKVLKVALTGGIGSGKSTVAEFWKDQGVHLFVSDQVAKKILVADEGVRTEVIRLFGTEAYSKKGELNRMHVAERAFSNSELLGALNALVHPRVRDQFAKQAAELESLEESSILVNEAALIFESGIEDLFDEVVIVWSPEEIRLERVVTRDQSDEKDVKKRMEKQLPQDNLRDRADYVIENTEGLEELEHRSSEVLQALRDLLQ